MRRYNLSACLIRDVLIGVGIAVALVTAGCGSSMTVAPKPVVQQVVAFDENTQNAGVIDCGENGCLVTPGWIKRYAKLGERYNFTILADKSIKAEGDNYRVPYECIVNYGVMRSAERNGP